MTPTEVQVTDSKYLGDKLAFRMSSGQVLFFGLDVLPGTDAPSYRFLYRGSIPREARRVILSAITSYCRGLGFSTPLDFLTSRASSTSQVGGS